MNSISRLAYQYMARFVRDLEIILGLDCDLIYDYNDFFLSTLLPEDKVRRQEVEQQRRLLEQRNQMQQQALDDLRRTNEENIRQLEAKVVRERERSQAEMERVVAAKLKVTLSNQLSVEC